MTGSQSFFAHNLKIQTLQVNVHILLIHVHIQVDLSAQVQVEEGVNAEYKEENCCDNQEGILQREEKAHLSFIYVGQYFLSFLTPK